MTLAGRPEGKNQKLKEVIKVKLNKNLKGEPIDYLRVSPYQEELRQFLQKQLSPGEVIRFLQVLRGSDFVVCKKITQRI